MLVVLGWADDAIVDTVDVELVMIEASLLFECLLKNLHVQKVSKPLLYMYLVILLDNLLN